MHRGDLNRRALLRTAGALSGILGLFYVSNETIDYVRKLGCPGPDSDRELPFETIQPNTPLFSYPDEPVALLTSTEQLDALPIDSFDPRTIQFVENVAFDEAFLLAIQMSVSGRDEGIRFTGIERLSESVVHSYSCVPDPSRYDVGAAGAARWLVRVEAEFTPSIALHTHQAHSETTFEAT